ncbi:MAG: hypothetical protein K940chlam9_00352 [Chlamydiae bacterium]|nr:hypothetical protein [Chlamydiota bacterium]
MSKSKLLAFAALFFVAIIFYFTSGKKESQLHSELQIEEELVVEAEVIPLEELVSEAPLEAPVLIEEEPLTKLASLSDDQQLPQEVDRLAALFRPQAALLPIVETITYKSRVPWVTDRSAYLGDYAAHHNTSKHFISRSLHGKGEYTSEVISYGDRFNVFRSDKEIEFHLVMDLSRLKMWFYCLDKGEDTRILLKTYPVAAGRLNESKTSGSLTPLGTFSIGSQITSYKKGVMGTFKGEPCEMITVFGRRWIPFNQEIANCTGRASGLGIHGVPFEVDEEGGYREMRECIGEYVSSGCVRLLTEDVEEVYAIIASKPSYIHVVSDFSLADLPGTEADI